MLYWFRLGWLCSYSQVHFRWDLDEGGHCLHHWSRTQATIALSSGEAELNASLKGGTELIGAHTLMAELGLQSHLELLGDSTACFGTLHREGAGRVKHLEVRQLWLQSKVKAGIIRAIKIPRADNPADSMAKSWDKDGPVHFAQMGFYIPTTTNTTTTTTPHPHPTHHQSPDEKLP